MKVTGTKIYDLEETAIASGFPMQETYDDIDFALEAERMRQCDLKKTDHYKRLLKFMGNPTSSGHCNAFTGILVAFNVTATVKWFHQAERYHFLQIVSSMSTMHRLKSMLRHGTLSVNSNTDAAVVDILRTKHDVDDYLSFEELVYSAPMGLELTARITTNYLQLMTIFNQRKNHKLKEWRTFCHWIWCLPYMCEFLGHSEEAIPEWCRSGACE